MGLRSEELCNVSDWFLLANAYKYQPINVMRLCHSNVGTVPVISFAGIAGNQNFYTGSGDGLESPVNRDTHTLVCFVL